MISRWISRLIYGPPNSGELRGPKNSSFFERRCTATWGPCQKHASFQTRFRTRRQSGTQTQGDQSDGSGEDGSALDDRRGGIMQILNGEDSEATMVDCYGLYWNAKAGPKKMNGKAAPVFTSRTQPVICMRAICVCFMRVHTLVSPITGLFWVVWFVSRLPPHVFLPNFVSNRKGRSGPCMYLDVFGNIRSQQICCDYFYLKKKKSQQYCCTSYPRYSAF